MSLSVGVYVCICVSVCLGVCICVCVHMSVYVCISVCMWWWAYLCHGAHVKVRDGFVELVLSPYVASMDCAQVTRLIQAVYPVSYFAGPRLQYSENGECCQPPSMYEGFVFCFGFCFCHVFVLFCFW